MQDEACMDLLLAGNVTEMTEERRMNNNDRQYDNPRGI